MQLDLFLEQQVGPCENDILGLKSGGRTKIIGRVTHVDDLIPWLCINEFLEFTTFAQVGVAWHGASVGFLI